MTTGGVEQRDTTPEPRCFAWSFTRRIMSRVQETQAGCWEWTGARTRNGYGHVKVGGIHWMAHRYAYTVQVGPIPDGLQLDHLCRNRACINPAHLEPVSHGENLRRGRVGRYKLKNTKCPSGHPYSGHNLVVRRLRDGRTCRVCRTCLNARRRARYSRRKSPES